MAGVVVVWIIGLVVRSVLCNSIAENECGILKIRQPAELNRDVMFTFQPKSPTPISYVVWYIGSYEVTSKVIPTNSQTYRITKSGDMFTMTIKRSVDADEDSYWIAINDKRNDKICDSDVVRLELQKRHYQNNCGTLAIRHPAVLYRDVTLIFLPKTATVLSDLYWIHRNIWRANNSTKYTIAITGQLFTLTIKHSLRSDEGDIYVRIRHGCDTNRIRLTLQELGPCGALYRTTNTPVGEGSSVEFRYIPANTTEHKWLYRPVTSDRYLPVTVDGTTVRETNFQINNEKDLVIQNIQPSQAGTYVVQCTESNGVTVQTEEWRVEVIEVPKDVHFTSANKTFTDCNECLYGLYGTHVYVECSFNEGQETPTVNIVVSSKSNYATRLSPGRYIIKGVWVYERFHLQQVQCELKIPNLQQAVVTNTTFYVLRIPSEPKITMATLKEGQPLNITCVSTRGRPPSQLTVLVGEETIKINQTDTQRYKKYDSVAVVAVDKVDRKWNKKLIKCCLDHETGRQCSETETIQYKFAPVEVKVNHTDLPEVYKPFYTVNVVCTVVDANPRCDGIININGTIVHENISRTYQQNEYGGTTTSLSYTFNVTQQDDGKLLTCSAKCSEFVDKLTDSFALILPDAPADNDEQTQDDSASKPQISIWIIIVGAFALIVVITVIIIVVLVKKRKSTKQADVPHCERRDDANYGDRDEDNLQAADHPDNVTQQEAQEAAVYSEIIPKDQRPYQVQNTAAADVEANQVQNTAAADVGALYSSVIPKPKRQKKSGAKNDYYNATGSEKANTKGADPDQVELHYADLDLDNSRGANAESRTPHQRPSVEVEYSDVNFELTAQHESTGQGNTGNENIYMNG